MMDGIIRWSIVNRWLVLVSAVVLLVAGTVVTWEMPVDVLPELTFPTVTVVVDAHGSDPLWIEERFTQPLEAAVLAVPGVQKVTSTTHSGVALIKAQLQQSASPDKVRQRLAEVIGRFEQSSSSGTLRPELTPETSILGEVMFLGLTSKTMEPAALREVAQGLVARRLSAVSGVAQVTVMGGKHQVARVDLMPQAMAQAGVSPQDVMEALRRADAEPAGGLLDDGQQGHQTVIGQVDWPGIEALNDVVVDAGPQGRVRLSQVARITASTLTPRGAASINGTSGVLVGVHKLRGANALRLTEALDGVLDDIEPSLPKGVEVHRGLFRAADFIELAVDNVTAALRDGALLVVLVVFFFLLSARSTFISALAIPLSLVVTALVLRWSGQSLNAMTLGGMAIAVGAIVDDAIIDVENVVRRLRERQAQPEAQRLPVDAVIYDASREVRGSIVFATVVIMLVFAPLFFLHGVEGRLMAPLGLSYVVALGASLLVALTVTPALAAVLLPSSAAVRRARTVGYIERLEKLYERALRFVVHRWVILAAVCAVGALGALVLVARAERSFLPEIRETNLTIEAEAPVGTSLQRSDELGRQIEQVLLAHPDVRTTARRTGRAEGDEHAMPVNVAEIDVKVNAGANPHEVTEALRQALDAKGPKGVETHIGAPIAHRVDHTLSGVPTNLAIKIYGPDAKALQKAAEAARKLVTDDPRVVEAWLPRRREAERTRVSFEPGRLAELGLTATEAASALELLLEGVEASHLEAGHDHLPVRVHIPNDALAKGPVWTPQGWSTLAEVAKIAKEPSPVVIHREEGQRVATVVVAASRRHLGSLVEDLRQSLPGALALPNGHHLEFVGQYRAAMRAQRTLLLVGLGVLLAVLALLATAFGSLKDALVVLLNLPLALVGGAVGMLFSGGMLSVATLIGFIALFGIATRNGIMLVSHIRHLRLKEGQSDPLEAVVQAATERLSPILMTAAASGLGLLPLALAAWEPGGELQGPMARVILAGLVSATALNLFVIPAVYLRWGRWGKGAKA